MPYVVFDNAAGMYIAKASKSGFSYAIDIDGAQVYRNRAGALDAVGEEDKSYFSRSLGSKKRKLKLPKNLEIREVVLSETGKASLKSGAYD